LEERLEVAKWDWESYSNPIMKSQKQKEHLDRVNANQWGENNRNWKGDKAGYKAIHHWIRKHLSRPEKCVACNERPSREVANLDGKYTRDLTTWQWMCRSCHLRMDDVANKAWKTKKTKEL